MMMSDSDPMTYIAPRNSHMVKDISQDVARELLRVCEELMMYINIDSNVVTRGAKIRFLIARADAEKIIEEAKLERDGK
jgi:hypothetical protein